MTTRRALLLGAAGALGAYAVQAALPTTNIDLSDQSNVFLPKNPVIPRDKFIFLPDAMHIDKAKVFVEDNTRTFIYAVMLRFNTTQNIAAFAYTDSDRYKEWMKDVEGIPPHIQFGGAVKAGTYDPTFRDRWEQRTLKHLREGNLK